MIIFDSVLENITDTIVAVTAPKGMLQLEVVYSFDEHISLWLMLFLLNLQGRTAWTCSRRERRIRTG